MLTVSCNWIFTEIFIYLFQMTNTFPSSSPTDDMGLNSDIGLDDVQRPPSSSAHELIEIQKIQNSLMSEVEAQPSPAVTGPGSLPPYTAVAVSSYRLCCSILAHELCLV